MTESSVPKGAKFHDGLARSWNESYGRGGFKKRLIFFRKLASSVVIPGEMWLDAGCGAGILTLELSKLGANGLAVDGSEEMIAAATRQMAHLCRNFLFKRIASISSIEVPTGCFDGVLCSSVVEYVDDVDEVLCELGRVLKVGGRLILSVPNKSSLVRRLQKAIRYSSRVVGRDFFSYLGVSANDFTQPDLHRRLDRCGFRVLTLQGFDPVLPGSLSAVVPPTLYFVVAEKKPSADR